MDLQEINKIIHEYDKLIELINSKLEFISKIDPYYSIENGIKQILFHDTKITVICNGNLGNEYCNYSFPIKWLVESDSFLVQSVFTSKELREHNLKIKEMELDTQKELKEKYEFEMLRKIFKSENS